MYEVWGWIWHKGKGERTLVMVDTYVVSARNRDEAATFARRQFETENTVPNFEIGETLAFRL